MTIEDNKEVVRRIYDEGFNRGDASVFDALYRPDFLHHSKTIHDVERSAEGERESMLRFREAIPDARFHIDEMVAEGDKVVVRLTVTGTPVKAFPPIEPGEPMAFRAVAIFRIEGGRAAEEWFYRDAGTGT